MTDVVKAVLHGLMLTGIHPLVGLLELLLVGFGITSAIIQFRENGKDQWKWAAFWLGMSLGTPISAYMIADALHHIELSGGETVFMVIVGVILYILGRQVGLWNSRRTASYTDRTLDLKSEWYMAKVAIPATFAILGTGWLVDLFAHTSRGHKWAPVIWLAGIVLVGLGIDQIRGRGVHNPEPNAN